MLIQPSTTVDVANTLRNSGGPYSSVLDLDDDGFPIFTMPCANALYGAAQVSIVKGTVNAFVLTVVVTCDPKMRIDTFQNHPSSITIGPTTLITSPFTLAGYMGFGVKLTTINTGDLKGEIFLACKGGPSIGVT